VTRSRVVRSRVPSEAFFGLRFSKNTSTSRKTPNADQKRVSVRVKSGVPRIQNVW
jgi:hypothetical protein